MDYLKLLFEALIYLAHTLQVFFLTFVLFCAILKLRDVRDAGKLQDAPWIFKLFAYLTLVVGFISDALLSILLSPILLDMPMRRTGRWYQREWLTTDKMIRLKREGNAWQKSCATWMCNQLTRIDDNHCGESK